MRWVIFAGLLSLLAAAAFAGQPASRIGDGTTVGGQVVAGGAQTVLVEGVPAALVGATVAGDDVQGTVVTGSNTVLIEGLPAARVGDLVVGEVVSSGASFSASLLPPGAPTVLIGQ